MLGRREFLGAVGMLALAGCTPRGTADDAFDMPADSAETADGLPTNEPDPGSEPAPTGVTYEPNAGAERPEGEAHILIAYYSRVGEDLSRGELVELDEGNTHVMAGFIQDALAVRGIPSDLHRITTAREYPHGYKACCDAAKIELDADERPELTSKTPDVSPYDVIFLGCPVWWKYEPMCIRTFIDEAGGLSGKYVVPFVTHGGSQLGKVETSLQSYIQGAAFLEAHAEWGCDIREGRSGVAESVDAWVGRLGLA